MKSFLLAAIVLIQAGPQSVGVVTGVVRGANGMPTPAVRVYAIGVRDSPEALNAGPAPLEGLTERADRPAQPLRLRRFHRR